MIRPFKDGMLKQACPMSDIIDELTSQLSEYRSLREQAEQSGFEMQPS